MIECFMVHPKGSGYVVLRRYSYKECPGGKHYHDATCRTTETALVTRSSEGTVDIIPAIVYDGHEKWPRKCAECGYEFDQHPPRADGSSDLSGYDQWQLTIDELWVDGVGRQWLFEKLPPGAMFDAFWTPWRGPDGVSLAVVLPGGLVWHVDGPTADGSHPWSRSGVMPVITATPSVQVEQWQGYLTSGHLADTLEWSQLQHPAGKG